MAVQVATLTKTTIWVRICQWVASLLKEMSLKLLIISTASHIYQVTRTLSFLHTNLVASVDAMKAQEDRLYQQAFDRAMAKVHSLWNLVSRSPKANNVVAEIAGCTFMQPVCTRRCSEYYAVEWVTSVGLDKVLECQTATSIDAKMTEANFTFMSSFQAVMKHTVTTTKCLEGENHCYLGHVIPTMTGLKNKLNRICDPAMRPLVQALLVGLSARFVPLISNHEHFLASMLLPKFKLAFLPADSRPHQKQMLTEYGKRLHADRGVDLCKMWVGPNSTVCYSYGCLILFIHRVT